MRFDRLERRELSRGELSLAYFDAGRSTKAGSVPVVFQHGLCGSAQQTAEAFPDDGRLRLLTLECRGHGASPSGSPRDFSIETFADDVIALIELQGVAPVILGGISMGAAIALRIGVQRPDLVRALILARPAWVTAAAPANMRPNAEVGELLANSKPDTARAIFEQSATAERLAAEAPDNLASLLGFFDREPQAATAELLQRISADGPGVTDDEAGALDVPALVIGSEADAIHPMAHARDLAKLLARSELVEITPKSVDRAAYVEDMHAALSAFIAKVSS
jgi:pimeloyl-ACP methyl ester carboxylesterase